MKARPAIRERTIRLAVFGLIFHLLFAFYFGAWGILTESVWFGFSSLTYLLLAVMRFFALINRKPSTTRSLRFTGVLLLLLSLVTAMVLYINLTENRASDFGTIPMIAIAAYTFSKISVSVVGAFQYRHEPSDPLLAIRAIGYAELAISVCSMQRSMLATFGNKEDGNSFILNLCTGCAACFFMIGLGFFLILKQRRGG